MAAVAAVALFAGSASANTVLAPDGALFVENQVYEFVGPGADVINTSGFPPQGTSVRVRDQGLLILRNQGTL